MYSIDGLERGIAQSRKNIRTFEDAIDKERATIKEYLGMIETLERKDKEIQDAKNNVKVEIVYDNQGRC